MDALRPVMDPEMMISIVDLGLIYDLRIRESDGHVDVDMTFTAMGCPAMDFMVGDVRDRLLREPEVSTVSVSVVWDPPWDHSRLTPRGAAALEAWGIVA